MPRTDSERLVAVETEMKSVSDKLENHVVEQREQFKEQKEDIKSLGDKIDNLPSKFAGKWVEKLAVGGTIALITGIVTLIAILL